MSTNCAARTTIGTLSTTLPAASAGSPNIIIATTDFVSDDAGAEAVSSGAGATGLYRDSALQAGMEYNFFSGTADQGNSYTFIFEDSGGSANEVYTVEGCATATSIETETKILAFQGLESSFVDNGNVATSAGSFVTIATLTTDLTANNHIIIAQVQIDADGASTIAAGDIELRNSADTMLSENEFEILVASAAAGDGSTITLIATNPSGATNTSYKVAVRETTSGLAGAEAKILAFKAANDEYFFTDGGSVGVTTTPAELANVATTFASGSKIAVISAAQFDDTDTSVEELITDAGHMIEEGSTLKAANEMQFGGLAASGSAGEGIRETLVWYNTVAGASQTYDSNADADATGLNGESKLLAFLLIESSERTITDTPVISDSSTRIKNSLRSVTDTPVISDSEISTGNFIRSNTDTPAIIDSTTTGASRSHTDTPVISDSTQQSGSFTRSHTDTPIISDNATGEAPPYIPLGKYIWFMIGPPTEARLGGVYALTCPDGEYVRGLFTNGTLICEPLP